MCIQNLHHWHTLFLGTHESVNIHAIFRVEPMHTFSLEVGGLIEKCLIEILSGLTRTSSAMRTNSGVQRPFRSVTKTVLASVGPYLKDSANASPASGVKHKNQKSSYVFSFLPPTLSLLMIGGSVKVSDRASRSGRKKCRFFLLI